MIEDDASMAQPMVDGLTRHGFTVAWASTGREGIELARSADCIILDLGLPDMDGLEVCEHIRERSEVPIIIVSARGQESDRVKGLEIGADDYVVKPFSLRELAARIRANVRRRPATAPSITIGNITIDRDARTASCAPSVEPPPYESVHEPASEGLVSAQDLSATRHLSATQDLPATRDLGLTPKEFDLLVVLSEQPGRVVPRTELYARIWDPVWVGSGKSLDVHVTTLRKKLPSTVRIEAIRGVGYRIMTEGDPVSSPDHH